MAATMQSDQVKIEPLAPRRGQVTDTTGKVLGIIQQVDLRGDLFWNPVGTARYYEIPIIAAESFLKIHPAPGQTHSSKSPKSTSKKSTR